MILDTNAISAFFEDIPAVCSAIGRSDVLAVPSIVLGEYRFGLEFTSASQSGGKTREAGAAV